MHNPGVLCWLFSVLLSEGKQHKQFMHGIESSRGSWVRTEHVLKCLGNALELGEGIRECCWFSVFSGGCVLVSLSLFFPRHWFQYCRMNRPVVCLQYFLLICSTFWREAWKGTYRTRFLWCRCELIHTRKHHRMTAEEIPVAFLQFTL